MSQENKEDKLYNFIEQQKNSAFRRKKVPGVKALDCRICGGETFLVVNLGYQPFANALEENPDNDVKTYPLKMHVCNVCSVGQLSYCADSRELYENYLYVSPDSTALSAHFKEVADFLKQYKYMDGSSTVLEIGSNVGHFLKFIEPHVKSIVGVDPAVNISKFANDRGVRTINDFFNIESAKEVLRKEGKKDLIVARHCFAHNEKPQLMLEGVRDLLSDEGVFVIENAYFLDTVNHCEVDQIYHEHMYFYNLRSIP